jgi:hypothetical protein
MTVDEAMHTGRDAVGAATGMAIGAGRLWVRTVIWGARTWVTVGTRITRAAVDPGSASRLVDGLWSGFGQAGAGLRSRAGGLRDDDGATAKRAGDSEQVGHDDRRNGVVSERVLRERGARLLLESADVSAADGAHPAYARILEELAPDEARILRLLMAEGPQPIVDVRATNLVGVATDLTAAALNMLGPEAGCRHRDRVPAYLNNLERLGLIEFSDKPLENPISYQVLEAQPEVLGAIKETSRAKSIHRTVRLTAFGKDFCDICLPLDTDEIQALREDVSTEEPRER